jgi:hypothetical protein
MLKTPPMPHSDYKPKLRTAKPIGSAGSDKTRRHGCKREPKHAHSTPQTGRGHAPDKIETELQDRDRIPGLLSRQRLSAPDYTRR